MATWHWTNPGQGGDWTDADWTGDGTQGAGQIYPSGTDTAVIGSGTTAAAAYTVTVSSSDDISVSFVTIDDGAGTLET